MIRSVRVLLVASVLSASVASAGDVAVRPVQGPAKYGTTALHAALVTALGDRVGGVGAPYVLDVRVTRNGWKYTARARLLDAESGVGLMDFRSAYFKPKAEAADRGRRIARRTSKHLEVLARLTAPAPPPAPIEAPSVERNATPRPSRPPSPSPESPPPGPPPPKSPPSEAPPVVMAPTPEAPLIEVVLGLETHVGIGTLARRAPFYASVLRVEPVLSLTDAIQLEASVQLFYEWTHLVSDDADAGYPFYESLDDVELSARYLLGPATFAASVWFPTSPEARDVGNVSTFGLQASVGTDVGPLSLGFDGLARKFFPTFFPDPDEIEAAGACTGVRASCAFTLGLAPSYELEGVAFVELAVPSVPSLTILLELKIDFIDYLDDATFTGPSHELRTEGVLEVSYAVIDELRVVVGLLSNQPVTEDGSTRIPFFDLSAPGQNNATVSLSLVAAL